MKDSEYRILYKGSIEGDLKKLKQSQRKRIVEKIEKVLYHNPYKGKKLKGEYQGLWRIRAGDYRVVYKIVQNDIVILAIGHRKAIYKGKYTV